MTTREDILARWDELLKTQNRQNRGREMGRYGHAEHDTDTITRWQLKRALGFLATRRDPVKFGGYFSTNTLADAVIDNVGYTTIDNSNSMGGNMTKPKST